MTGRPEELHLGPIPMRVQYLPDHAQVTDAETGFDSLCWILAGAVQEGGQEILDAIQSGEPWFEEIHELRPVELEEDREDLELARADWLRRTGEPLEGELCYLSVGGLPVRIVPLADLQSLARELWQLGRG